jgi:L-ascorbate metabolism protein UlaG (beta-lactamase superfamily)
MKVTYFGHACFLVEVNGSNLLFDPFITPNEKAAKIDITTIKADYILVSHGHVDHVADVEAIAKNTEAKLISNYEIVSWFGAKGVTNGHPMNHGGSWTFDFGKVKYVNAVHSSTLPDGSGGGNPGGFVIETKEGSFYFAGDTALTYDMKLIGEMHNIDFAILPIGDNFTMGVDDAAVASRFINCKNIIGMHYDTFGYIEIDHDEAKRKFKEKGAELTLLKIGEKIEI